MNERGDKLGVSLLKFVLQVNFHPWEGFFVVLFFLRKPDIYVVTQVTIQVGFQKDPGTKRHQGLSTARR